MLNVPGFTCEKYNVQMRKYLPKADNRDTRAISMITRITSRKSILRNWKYFFSFALVFLADFEPFCFLELDKYYCKMSTFAS